jgi:hypothetical protein
MRTLALFFISLLCLGSLEATKRFSRVTLKKCQFCHRSKKGGGESLKERGLGYLAFRDTKGFKRTESNKRHKGSQNGSKRASVTPMKASTELMEFWNKVMRAARLKRRLKRKKGRGS